MNVDTQVGSTSQKELVVVRTLVGTGVGETGKAVQVQLSLKGRDLALPKEPRQDVLDKDGWVVDTKGTPVRLPRHNPLQPLFRHAVEHPVQQHGKRGTHATVLGGHHGKILNLRVVLGMVVVVVFRKVTPVVFGGEAGVLRCGLVFLLPERRDAAVVLPIGRAAVCLAGTGRLLIRAWTIMVVRIRSLFA